MLCAAVVWTCGSSGTVVRAERMSEISWIAWSSMSDPRISWSGSGGVGGVVSAVIGGLVAFLGFVRAGGAR